MNEEKDIIKKDSFPSESRREERAFLLIDPARSERGGGGRFVSIDIDCLACKSSRSRLACKSPSQEADFVTSRDRCSRRCVSP